MATFIKAGFWETLCQKCLGYKGWLNLDKFVEDKINASGGGYKVYTALLTQETEVPFNVIVLENTIGDIVWTNIYPGLYIATLANAFPLNKTALFISNSAWNNYNVTLITHSGSDDEITVETLNTDWTRVDNILGYTTVEIRVYS